MKQFNIVCTTGRPVALLEYDENGRLVRETPEVTTLREVCRRFRKSRRQVYRYLQTGSLQPLGKFLGEWLFDGREVDRLAKRFDRLKRQRSLRLPSGFKPLFQEHDAGALHPALDAELIISRILDRGTAKEVRWLFQHYPSREIRAVLSQQGPRLLSDRSLQFWSWWFEIPAIGRPAWRRRGRQWGGAP
jgi:hypothetical protein